MFEIPGSDVISVHIAEDVVLGKSEPMYIRGKPVSSGACSCFDPKMSALTETFQFLF